MIEAAWESRSRWLLLLKPLEWMFRSLVALRAGLYRRGWLKAVQSPTCVVVVGNLRVGGSGKTPTVIALAELLQAAGYRPGVVSRGYGGRAGSYPLRLEPGTPVSHSGDEPLLIHRRCAAPVVVDPDRNRAVAELAPDCDVVISDDGLQHYAMGRDLEVVLVDDSCRDSACLPCGPLREPLSRLAAADWVLPIDAMETYTGAKPAQDPLQLIPLAWVNLASGERCSPKAFNPPGRLAAIAGIARPKRFFQVLQGLGLRFEPAVFPDHHAYCAADLLNINADTVLMTEKDAVKCEAFAQPQMWYLEIRARLPAAFEASFLQRIEQLKNL